VPCEGPTRKIASAMMAMTVLTRIPMSSAPLTRRAMSTPMMTSAMRKTTVGSVAMEPWSPSCTGGEATPLGRTKPASTRPMNAMNRPMPTVMAVFSSAGTALKISTRRPVDARSTMMRPLMTTRPIASGHVTCPTTLTARNELMPRPAAMPKGRLEITPMRIVMTPAVSAVTALTALAAR
jgi:hypothetical protein